MHRKVIYTALAWTAIEIAAGVTTGELHASAQASAYQSPRRPIQQQPQAWTPPIIAAAGDATAAYATTSHQIVSKTIVYEETTSPNFPIQPQARDQVSWHVSLTIPTRRIVSTNDHRAFFPIQPQARDQVSWHQPLNEPLRLKRLSIAGYPVVSLNPQVFVPWDWRPKLDDPPTRLRRSLYAQQTFGYANFTPTVVATGDATLAFGSTSHQVINKTVVFESDAYTPYTPAAVVETITIDKWWQQLDIPTRRKQITAEEGSIFASPPRPEANDQVAWYRPLEAPTRAKRLPQGAIPFEARNPFPVVPWGWYVDLDKPVRLAKTPANQIGYSFIAAAPGRGTEYNWFQPIDWPTRARRLLEFPFAAIPTYFVPPTPGSGFEYNWWSPLDEPIRPRPSIKTAAQWPVAIPPRLLTTTLENGWFAQLNEPVRLKVTFGKYPGGSVQGNYDPLVPQSWTSIDDPRRQKRIPYESNAPVVQYQIVEIITADKWFTELGRPVRLKRINYPALSQGNVNPVVPFAHTYLHSPHRLKGRIDYPALTAQGNISPIVAFPPTYLHTPHRLKGRINYPALAQGTVNPATTQVGKFTQWWRQLDLPVREWRKIAWQHFLAMPPTAVSFFVEGGPADESERVACVPSSSRTATPPELLRSAAVPVEQRGSTVPALLRVVDVPDETRTVASNDFRDRPCHDT